MKTLYINISGENIQSKDDVVVVGKPTDDLAYKFYFELGYQILKGVIAPSVKNKRELITEFIQQHKDVYEEKILPQLEQAKRLMLSNDFRGDVKVQLPQEYIQWLNYYGTTDYSAIARSLNERDGIVTINLERIYRNGIQLLINGIEPGDYGQLVVNDEMVEDDTEMVVAIREKMKNPMLPFIPYSEYGKNGENPSNENACQNKDSVGQSLFIVFKEETGGTLYHSMSHEEYGLYNIHGEMCLPIGRYEHIYNKNYPNCLKKAFNWFKQQDGQTYYYLSEDKCIMLGEFADATPLNEQYLAVKKNEDSVFSCIIDSDGKEIISAGNIGNVVGTNSEGYIVCETAPGIWGVKNIHTGKEIPFKNAIDPDSFEINPYYPDFLIHTYIKGKKNSGKDEIIHIEGDKIKYYKEPFDETFTSFNGNFHERQRLDMFLKGYFVEMVIGESIINGDFGYFGFEGIIDDIAYRHFGTKEDKEDYGFVYLPMGGVYQGLQIIFKIGNYCIVSKKDSEFRRSRRCDQCGIIDISTGEKIVGTHYDVIYYLSQFIERPIFLLEEEDKLTLFDPQKNKRVNFRCSYIVNILYADGVINVIDQLDNGRNALLIFDIDGNVLYHDKWGTLDSNSSEDELTPCFHTFENGQLKEIPRDYVIMKTGETMGVLDSSGNSIVPSIYGDVKLFRPLNSYCRKNGIAVFMDNWDIIDKFII